MQAQTELSPRGPGILKPGAHSNDLGVQGYRDAESHPDAAGYTTGAVLHDSAESSDAPTWLAQMGAKHGVPRHSRPLPHHSNDLGVQGYRRNINPKDAAGHRTGAVLDDSAESGDAPLWMRNMGANYGVLRSKHVNMGGLGFTDSGAVSRKTTFDEQLFEGRAGCRTNAILDDSAQSNDAPAVSHRALRPIVHKPPHSVHPQ